MYSIKVFVILLVGVTLGEEAYGPFEFHAHSVRVCKGPKKRDCTKIKLDLTNDKRKLLVQVNVFEENKIEESRMLITKTGKPNLRPVMNLQIRKPCDQIVLRPYLQALVSNASCRVPKGSYNMTVELNAVMESLWAGEFFYGNFTSKATFFSAKCNFACNLIDISYMPKH